MRRSAWTTINEPQPDAMLYIDVDRSTTFRLGLDGYLKESRS